MSYRRSQSFGFERWGVTNPWVFANYGQPQRRRGYVSPMVMQTAPPRLRNYHLGQVVEETPEQKRARRMERYAIAGLALSALSAVLVYRRMEKMK